MHLLDKPNGYASAMVKNSLSHQMRFAVQVLEKELCAAGNPHVLQIKLLGDDSREPSSWKLFADGECIADGSGAFARECFCEGAEVFLDLIYIEKVQKLPLAKPESGRILKNTTPPKNRSGKLVAALSMPAYPLSPEVGLKKRGRPKDTVG